MYEQFSFSGIYDYTTMNALNTRIFSLMGFLSQTFSNATKIALENLPSFHSEDYWKFPILDWDKSVFMLLKSAYGVI